MPAGGSDTAGESGVDMQAFRAMARECGWTVAEFAAFYRAGARDELEGLRSAAAQGNHAEVARLAHGARGSSAAACVPGMAAAFLDLENAATGGAQADIDARLAEAAARLERVLAALAQASD